MSAAIMSTAQRQRFKDAQEVDLAYSVAGLGRFRVNVFQQRGTVGLVLRVIPMQIRTDRRAEPPAGAEDRSPMEERGLVLVTGTTGSRQEHVARRDDRLHEPDTAARTS